jgi:galactokinase
MTASHTSCRVTLRLSSVQVEATVGAALHAGALGARLVLPAYWGPVVALVPADRVDDVAAAAQGTAASLGFPVPRATRLAPGGAAHRAW